MSTQGDFLLYGANGYTGELAARRAVALGLRPILAGRSAAPVEALARALSLPSRVFSLDDPAAVDAALAGVKVVLHCAGPFSRTSGPMVDGCLRSGAHYLDVTGEVEVFEALAARDAEARRAGVMLLPGAGFDVVPSDCLAAHLKRRLPGAVALELAFQPLGRASRGTATTMIENIDKGGLIRKGGALVHVPAGHATRVVDFGRGPVTAAAIPWGDVSTAYHSTGIPDITVYMGMPLALRIGMRVTRVLGGLLSSAPVQRFLLARVRAGAAGPSDAERARGASLLWGEARDAEGKRVVSRLRAPEGYTHTADASIALVQRVLGGEHPAGFQTPSKAYGADFVLGLPGVERSDEG